MRGRIGTTMVALVISLGLAGSSVAAAQDVPSSSAPPAPSPAIRALSAIASDFRNVAAVDNALIAGVGAALALAMHPEDNDITRRAQANEPLEEAFDGGSVLGDGWVQVGAAMGTYAIGTFTSNRKAQAVGGELFRAQILNGVMTSALKVSFSRTRPDGSQHSFPSGHASAAFASATILQREFGWKIGAPLYAAASYVAASRLSENKHYASDVIFGSAVGIIAGRSVSIGSGANRFAVVPVPLHGGAAVTFTRVTTP